MGWWPKKWKRQIPPLVVRDKEGKPYSVRYDQVNAMLLNEFLKEQQDSAGSGNHDRGVEEGNCGAKCGPPEVSAAA